MKLIFGKVMEEVSKRWENVPILPTAGNNDFVLNDNLAIEGEKDD